LSRFISFDDDLPGPASPADIRRTLGRTAIASVLGLLVVIGTSVWTALAFAGRGSTDIAVTHRTGPNAVALPDEARYTTSFLMRAELPFLLAVLLCAAAFIWWHATVDSAARECGDMLVTPRRQVVGGWFFPGGNLVFPIRSMRELAGAHGARPAELIAIPWWAFSVAATFVTFFLLRAGAQSSAGPHRNESGVTELGRLDNYGIVVGCLYAAAALLAVALVWNLTAAVRARLTER
jgi:Domain of unknown function (DUF4328)